MAFITLKKNEFEYKENCKEKSLHHLSLNLKDFHIIFYHIKKHRKLYFICM